MARKLPADKLEALSMDKPDVIVTANIGCQLHLETRLMLAVRHWVDILDQALL